MDYFIYKKHELWGRKRLCRWPRIAEQHGNAAALLSIPERPRTPITAAYDNALQRNHPHLVCYAVKAISKFLGGNWDVAARRQRLRVFLIIVSFLPVSWKRVDSESRS